MTEQPPHEYDDTRPLTGDRAHRYASSDSVSSPGAPTQASHPSENGRPGEEQASRRPSNGFVAAIVAAALVVGGLSGVAGAAGFTVLDHLTDNGSAPVTSSTVGDAQALPAAKGSPQQVAASVLPSVVQITVNSNQGQDSGSGIILSSDGTILTNNHVVASAGTSGTIVVNFNDGAAKKATVIGTDPVTDLAVIKAQDVSGVKPATIGNSDALSVGQPVVAIGSPFGLESTVTSGIVSALNRPVQVGETQNTNTIYPAIQTDAAINPGNSGGPLVNMAGQVIGINSSIFSASQDSLSGGQAGSIGLGFAIPISTAWPVVKQLWHGITPTHALMGVEVTGASSDAGLLTGAGIVSVSAGSPAQKAGLARGDVVTRVNNIRITGQESLVATIRGFRPGDKVTITYYGTDKKMHSTTVTLASDGGTASS